MKLIDIAWTPETGDERSRPVWFLSHKGHFRKAFARPWWTKR